MKISSYKLLLYRRGLTTKDQESPERKREKFYRRIYLKLRIEIFFIIILFFSFIIKFSTVQGESWEVRFQNRSEYSRMDQTGRVKTEGE